MNVTPRWSIPIRSVAGFMAAASVMAACSTDQTETSGGSELPQIAAETTVVVEDPTPQTEQPGTPDTTEEINLATRPLPGTAAELAIELTEVELAIINPETEVAQLSDLGVRQQALYQLLDLNRDWVEEVEAGIAPEVKPVFDHNWSAKQALTSLVAAYTLSDVMPAWRLAEPDPADDLLALYKAAGEESGIEWQYLAAINLVETRMGRIEGVSTAGAVGPMQFLPTTWAECCEGDPTVAADAIPGAAQYLTNRGGPSDMDAAIKGYNNSDFYVEAVQAYAEVLRLDERSYHAYHGWRVYFRTSQALVLMPSDYEEPEEVPVAEWLEANPSAVFPEGYGN